MNLYVVVHRQTRKPAMIDISSNDGGEFCNSYRAEISEHGSIVAAYTDKGVAEGILSKKEEVKWYNSGFECPIRPESFKPDDYEVVTVSL